MNPERERCPQCMLEFPRDAGGQHCRNCQLPLPSPRVLRRERYRAFWRMAEQRRVRNEGGLWSALSESLRCRALKRSLRNFVEPRGGGLVPKHEVYRWLERHWPDACTDFPKLGHVGATFRTRCGYHGLIMVLPDARCRCDHITAAELPVAPVELMLSCNWPSAALPNLDEVSEGRVMRKIRRHGFDPKARRGGLVARARNLSGEALSGEALSGEALSGQGFGSQVFMCHGTWEAVFDGFEYLAYRLGASSAHPLAMIGSLPPPPGLSGRTSSSCPPAPVRLGNPSGDDEDISVEVSVETGVWHPQVTVPG